MTKRVTIIDYGIGNLYSVRRAVEVSGGEDIRVSGRPEDIAEADKLILPGVGAFEDGMNGLRERGLVPHIIAAARAGKPLLGICLGMQLLATTSEEFGLHSGLGLIPGEVKPIPRMSIDGDALKVPFIGWSPLTLNARHPSQDSCLANVQGKAVYLVHSYELEPNDPTHLLASYSVGGHMITAAVRHGNVTGVQFHPEKSGTVGLKVISAFLTC
jgi:glutamine amidotransferase